MLWKPEPGLCNPLLCAKGTSEPARILVQIPLMEFQNLHYLMYVVDWYSSLSNDTVLSQPLGNEMMLPNSAVPSGPPVSWPSPRLGTKGPGFPDIANQSQHLIWEVKTGGGFGGAMGTRWPDDDYVIRGSARP